MHGLDKDTLYITDFTQQSRYYQLSNLPEFMEVLEDVSSKSAEIKEDTAIKKEELEEELEKYDNKKSNVNDKLDGEVLDYMWDDAKHIKDTLKSKNGIKLKMYESNEAQVGSIVQIRSARDMSGYPQCSLHYWYLQEIKFNKELGPSYLLTNGDEKMELSGYTFRNAFTHMSFTSSEIRNGSGNVLTDDIQGEDEISPNDIVNLIYATKIKDMDDLIAPLDNVVSTWKSIFVLVLVLSILILAAVITVTVIAYINPKLTYLTTIIGILGTLGTFLGIFRTMFDGYEKDTANERKELVGLREWYKHRRLGGGR